MRPLRCLLVCALALLPLPAAAAGSSSAEGSGLPLPRFVSLRSDEVNLRTGPGARYPVDWVYARKDLPVEIVAEHENWRKIRDWQGTEGWVHQSMLSGRRMLVVTGKEQRTMRKSDAATAPPAAVVEPGVTGRLLKCPRHHGSCLVELGGVQGWLKRDEFWGVYSSEWLE
ncbi:MAG: hypothetical protein K2Q10_10795 [Rhodospirillales bacterium]|nr:hypothetical protein [Rhodospirillales bacterium]